MSDPISSPSALSGVGDDKATARARVGRTIKNKWRLDALLGVGGMASVYAASHRNGSRAALKILHAEFGRDANIRERFLREGYVANRIEHPGRVAILDDDVTEQNEPFLVMELLEGETAHDLWKRHQRKVAVPEALWIASEVLDTLTSFHAEGIVHRDLKPANIFITKDRVVKLLDFGVARMREAGGDKTRAGTALGTPSFMAPEQAMGLTDGVDGRADLFSVGATLYALLGGQRLHYGRSDNEAFILAATQPAPSLARIAPDLPTPVIALVDRALAWDPRQRHADAAAMRADVLRIIEEVGGRRLESARPTIPEEPSFELCTDDDDGPIGRRGLGASLPPAELIEIEDEAEAAADDPAIVRLVDLFRRVDRLLPSVRQYGWDHAETDQKLRASFEAALLALNAERAAVRVALEPYSFVHRGRTVWEPSPPFDGVPYHLFAAGVRTLRLLPGFTEVELRALCEVFLLDPVRDMSPEDDHATALWERRLEHVSCEVVQTFAEGDAADRARFYEEADSVEAAAQTAALERADRAEAAAMAVETDRAALIAARRAASALALDPVAKKALGAQLALSKERWSERYVDALAAGLVDAHRRGDLEIVTFALAASVTDLFVAHEVGTVFTLHEALSKAVGEGADAALQDELARGMFPPEALGVLAKELAQPTNGRGRAIDARAVAGGLASVLPHLGPAHLEAALDLLAVTKDADLRAGLSRYVERAVAGHEGAIVDRLMTLDADLARPLVKAIGASRTATSVEALGRLSTSANLGLRCEAIAALASSPEEIASRLSELAESDRSDVRAAALRTLARHQVRSAGPLLVRRVQDASFHALSLEERREVLGCLHALHQARAEALAIEVVGKHGLLTDTSVEETRSLAAELLGKEARSDDALTAVLAASKRRWWNSEPLREAATKAAEAIAARLGKRLGPNGEVLA